MNHHQSHHNTHFCCSISVKSDFFNGMIYPKGLSKNSTCMTEYINQEVSLLKGQSHRNKEKKECNLKGRSRRK